MNIRTSLVLLIALVALALPAAAQKSPILSILEVVITAEINNPTLKSQALQLVSSQVNFERYMASSDARIDQMSATLQWDGANLTFRQGKVNQLLSVAESYVNLQQSNKNMSILQARLRLAQDDLKKAAERVAIGAASPVEELQAKVSLLSAELNLTGARNTRQFTTLPSFAAETGIHVAVLDSAVLNSEPPDLPTLASLDSYLSTTAGRAENDHAARELEIGKLNLQLLSSTSTSSLDLQTATNAVTISQDNVVSTGSDLQSATANAYASAQQMFGTVTLRKLQRELQLENTRRTQEQHTAGLLTDSQLISSKIDLVDATQSLRAAQWSAYFAWVRLHRAAGTDVLAIWDAR